MLETSTICLQETELSGKRRLYLRACLGSIITFKSGIPKRLEETEQRIPSLNGRGLGRLSEGSHHPVGPSLLPPWVKFEQGPGWLSALARDRVPVPTPANCEEPGACGEQEVRLLGSLEICLHSQ